MLRVFFVMLCPFRYVIYIMSCPLRYVNSPINAMCSTLCYVPTVMLYLPHYVMASTLLCCVPSVMHVMSLPLWYVVSVM